MATHSFLPGEFHGQRSLAGYSPWGGKESDTTEATNTSTLSLSTAPLLDVRCVWGPGRGGHHGPLVPAAAPWPLRGPLCCLTLWPALALSWRRSGQPCLFQAGPPHFLAGVCWGRAGVEGAGTGHQTSYCIQTLGLQSLPKHFLHFPPVFNPLITEHAWPMRQSPPPQQKCPALPQHLTGTGRPVLTGTG